MLAAVFGVPVSAASYLFLVAANKLQKWLYTMLPGQLGFHGVPAWWPFPLLLLGGLAVAAAIKYLPGTGGHKPADGLKVGGLASARELPGIAVAALITLGTGAVLGPEAPLIALGGGLCAWAVRHAVKGDTNQAVVVLGAAGSFAAISTLLGSPLVGAFLLMEAAGLSSAMLELVLLPGLLAAGVGALVFTGLGHWTGLGTFSLALRVRRPAERWIMIATPVAGLVVAGLAVLFSQVSGHNVKYVLFSGQNELSPLFANRAAFGIGALFLLLACKGLAYSVSLATFRGGPVFPSIFLGAAFGLLLGQVPGLSVVAAMGMGIGAFTAAMLRLPLTAALLAALLLSADAASVTPLAIVSVVVAYVASEHLDPRIAAQTASAPPAAAAPTAAPPAAPPAAP